ncbi:MAG: sulfatase-like hydrolase/transferase [Planctomycetia bacterium]|nr:sulfatase-like hydrolase/transferase [Planctomycetia bacterium]
MLKQSCRLVIIAGLMLTALFPAVSSAADARRPNVLWICADDHAAYVCGAYGNRIVRTPNLDRLAAGGMRFDQAFCNSPVCTASRQSFLTGRYPRTIGVTQLSTALPESELTLAELLAGAGYSTAAIGKMHFNSPLKHGFETRLDMPEYQKLLQAKGKTELPAGVDVQPQWKPFRDPARIWLNSGALPFGAVDAEMPGTYFAEQAVQQIAEHGEKARQGPAGGMPFFMMVSFYEPHSPFHFPVEFRGRHRAEEFVAPPVGREDDWQIPAIFRDLTAAEKQGIAAAYYTSAEFLDRNVGRVLDALKSAGLEDDTLVVYTGDHGYMLGQHGRFEKHCSYDPAIRAPLFMRYPGKIKPAGATPALVEFIDIAPTVLEFCGVTAPHAIQGKSLVPVLEQPARKHRDEVFVEYSENEEAAIRTDRWKLVYTSGRRERQDGYATGKPLPGRTIRLFDLERDPEEMTNLAERPEHAPLVAELTRKLADHLRRTARQPDLLPQTGDVLALLDQAVKPRDVRAKPNIVFILADDLGYGDLGCYGQRRIRTPHIDALAAGGMRFTQCYAGSTVCAPSRCVLMTGRHTGHCTVRGNALVPLKPEDVTVAEVLKSAGYATALVGKWGLGEPDTTGLPNRQGFDEFFGFLNQHHAHNYYPDYLWRNEQKVPLENVVPKDNIASVRKQYAPDLFTEQALAFLDRNAERPFFLYLAYTLPHANNERGRAEGNGMEVPDDAPYSNEPWPAPQKNHAAMITRLDADVGRVLARLKALGLDQDTLVIFSSDNGPHKEGGGDPLFFESAGLLRGHKRDLTDGGIRVPFIVRWPGKIPAGSTSDQVAWFADYLPTAAEIAGAKPPADLDGQSLVPALLLKAPPVSRTLYWEFHEGGFKQAVRLGDWKAIRLRPGTPLELYDVVRDPSEKTNVATAHPDVVTRIEEFLKTARTDSPNFPVRQAGAK